MCLVWVVCWVVGRPAASLRDEQVTNTAFYDSTGAGSIGAMSGGSDALSAGAFGVLDVSARPVGGTQT